MTIDLGMLVRSKLFEKNLTQHELAKMVGISDSYLTDILRGRKTGPKANERVTAIKHILNIKEGD